MEPIHALQLPMVPSSSEPASGSSLPPEQETEMRKAATAFESVFLTEMLTMAGLGKVPEAFGGGVGEQGFSDFLTREYAAQISQSRSIGLADHIYHSLVERSR